MERGARSEVDLQYIKPQPPPQRLQRNALVPSGLRHDLWQQAKQSKRPRLATRSDFVLIRAAGFSVKSARAPRPCWQARVKPIWRGSDRVAPQAETPDAKPKLARKRDKAIQSGVFVPGWGSFRGEGRYRHHARQAGQLALHPRIARRCEVADVAVNSPASPGTPNQHASSCEAPRLGMLIWSPGETLLAPGWCSLPQQHFQ